MTALAVVADDEPVPALSPARQALADHIAIVGRARTKSDNAAAANRRLREQLTTASDDHDATSAKIAEHEQQHAEALAAAAQDGTAAPTAKPYITEKLTKQAEAAQASKASLSAALRLSEPVHNEAQRTLHQLTAKTDGLTLAVSVEMIDELTEGREQLRRDYLEAEALLQAASAAIFERANNLPANATDQRQAWRQAGEATAVRYGKLTRAETTPAAVQQSIARWIGNFTQLAATAKG
jgi:hypothetical protein